MESFAVSPPSSEEELINRILASRHFTKAPLLSAFLSYVYRRAAQDSATRITEHEIGVHVFGREEGYDSKADNIVRNYARQLRRRLEDYYGDEGREALLRVEIPKGGYVPVFSTNQEADLAPLKKEEQHQEPKVPGPALEPTRAAHPRWFERAAWGLIVCLLTTALIILGEHARKTQPTPHGYNHLLWTQLFSGKRTVIVPADTALVTLEDMQGKTFSLAEYANWSSVEEPLPRFISALKTRKYTSVISLQIVSQLELLPEMKVNRSIIRSSRALTVEDLKDENLIFIGSIYSIPWIELFQGSLNFQFCYRPAEGRSWIENRHPLPGEASTYSSRWDSIAENTYAVIALVPNLNRTGHILLLQGLDGAGTEAAADLLFHSDKLLPILNKVRRPDGTLGSFEVLIESSSLDARSTSTHIIAVRTTS